MTPGDGEAPLPLFTGTRFRVERVPQPCNDGSLRDREVIIHPGSVVVLPMVNEDAVCLVEVLRVAVEGTLLELPAGTLDRAEPPIATAARELAEETATAQRRSNLPASSGCRLESCGSGCTC